MTFPAMRGPASPFEIAGKVIIVVANFKSPDITWIQMPDLERNGGRSNPSPVRKIDVDISGVVEIHVIVAVVDIARSDMVMNDDRSVLVPVDVTNGPSWPLSEIMIPVAWIGIAIIRATAFTTIITSAFLSPTLASAIASSSLRLRTSANRDYRNQ